MSSEQIKRIVMNVAEEMYAKCGYARYEVKEMGVN